MSDKPVDRFATPPGARGSNKRPADVIAEVDRIIAEHLDRSVDEFKPIRPKRAVMVVGCGMRVGKSLTRALLSDRLRLAGIQIEIVDVNDYKPPSLEKYALQTWRDEAQMIVKNWPPKPSGPNHHGWYQMHNRKQRFPRKG